MNVFFQEVPLEAEPTVHSHTELEMNTVMVSPNSKSTETALAVTILMCAQNN